MMVGLFGAGWSNIRLADGTFVIVDNYWTATAAATLKLYTPMSDTCPDYMATAIFSTRTAQNLNSGILPYGSSASMVSRLAADSWK